MTILEYHTLEELKLEYLSYINDREFPEFYEMINNLGLQSKKEKLDYIRSTANRITVYDSLINQWKTPPNVFEDKESNTASVGLMIAHMLKGFGIDFTCHFYQSTLWPNNATPYFKAADDYIFIQEFHSDVIKP